METDPRPRRLAIFTLVTGLAGAIIGGTTLLFSVLTSTAYCFLGLLVLSLLIGSAVLMFRTRRSVGAAAGHRALKRLALTGLLLGCFGLAAIVISGCVQFYRAIAGELSLGQVRNLAMAMHQFHEEHKHFPAHAIYSQDGKPLLSWRVAILPYFGQEGRALYSRFHVDEPWDSEHNLPLLQRMPGVFRRPWPYQKDDTKTHYQVFVGPGAIFEGPTTLTVGKISVADGASMTILIADAAEAVPWTKPADLVYDPEGPLPALGGMHQRKFQACFADATARHQRYPTTDTQIRLLRQLITWNGGEKEDISDILE